MRVSPRAEATRSAITFSSRTQYGSSGFVKAAPERAGDLAWLGRGRDEGELRDADELGAVYALRRARKDLALVEREVQQLFTFTVERMGLVEEHDVAVSQRRDHLHQAAGDARPAHDALEVRS